MEWLHVVAEIIGWFHMVVWMIMGLVYLLIKE